MQPFDAAAFDDDTYKDSVDDGEDYGDAHDDDTGRRRRRRGKRHSARSRRSRWRMVLIGGATVLVVYYGLVFFGMRQGKSDAVPLETHDLELHEDRVDFAVDATNVDPSGGAFDMRLRPIPLGAFEGDTPGQLAVPLQVQVSSPGQPPLSYDFPADQIIDPVAATVDATSGAQGFPFDQPQVAFRLQATTTGASSGEGEDQPDATGAEAGAAAEDEADEPERVPVGIEISDGTEGWNLSGQLSERADVLTVDIDADRELLAISFSLFYIAGTVVVALITVALIGGALARSDVGFDQVIWLGAMLVAIPAVRNEMPGVPPIGTLVDLFVFLPSVVIVAMALLAAIVVLAINEAAANKVTADGG